LHNTLINLQGKKTITSFKHQMELSVITLLTSWLQN